MGRSCAVGTTGRCPAGNGIARPEKKSCLRTPVLSTVQRVHVALGGNGRARRTRRGDMPDVAYMARDWREGHSHRLTSRHRVVVSTLPRRAREIAPAHALPAHHSSETVRTKPLLPRDQVFDAYPGTLTSATILESAVRTGDEGCADNKRSKRDVSGQRGRRSVESGISQPTRGGGRG